MRRKWDKNNKASGDRKKQARRMRKGTRCFVIRAKSKWPCFRLKIDANQSGEGDGCGALNLIQNMYALVIDKTGNVMMLLQ